MFVKLLLTLPKKGFKAVRKGAAVVDMFVNADET
jgi:hypothetical protein